MRTKIAVEATTSDLPEIVRLVNSAYRGESARQGWTHEGELLDGQRTDAATLALELAGPDPATILCLREDPQGPILACVLVSRIEADDGRRVCYLGMLTVSPTLQARGIGRALLQEVEAVARLWQATAIVMTVISARHELIAWYERRGYVRTGETKPFPYGDARFGEPRHDGLEFVVLEKPLSFKPLPRQDADMA